MTPDSSKQRYINNLTETREIHPTHTEPPFIFTEQTLSYTNQTSALLKMSVLTASMTTAVAPSTPIAPPKPVQVNFANLARLVFPALSSSLYFAQVLQEVISTTTLFLLFRSYIVSGILLRQFGSLSWLLLVQSLYASVLVGKQAGSAALWSFGRSWKALEPLRKKLAFEFFTTILGSGNQLILVLFWPGWIFVWGGMGLWFVLA